MCSEQCIELVNEMSKEIGKVNIYDIYEPCFNNLPSTVQRARYVNTDMHSDKNIGVFTHACTNCIKQLSGTQ